MGSAPVPDFRYNLIRNRCKFLVAADGGGDTILAHGDVPDAVIGDLDSLSEAGRRAIPGERLHRIAEQESTDFDKALRSITAPMVLALGVSGARIDHELAALSTLVRRCNRPVILIGEEDIALHCPARIRLDLPEGMRVSLYALRPVRVWGAGLRWPEDGMDLVLDPITRLGTSNEVRGGPVTLRAACPGVLILLPLAALEAAMAGLAAADLPSPPA